MMSRSTLARPGTTCSECALIALGNLSWRGFAHPDAALNKSARPANLSLYAVARSRAQNTKKQSSTLKRSRDGLGHAVADVEYSRQQKANHQSKHRCCWR